MTVKQDLIDGTKIISVVRSYPGFSQGSIGVLTHKDFEAIEIGLLNFITMNTKRNVFSFSKFIILEINI
jgi:hypothetical protein